MILDDVMVIDGEAVPYDGPRADRAARRPNRPGAYQWLTLADPDDAELAPLVEEFGIHPIAVEDAGEEHQRAKVETYGDVVLIVLKTLREVSDSARFKVGEINLFLGSDFGICVLHGDAVRDDSEGWLPGLGEEFLRMGPLGAAYAFVDAVVDAYEVLAEELTSATDELDVDVFESDRDHLPSIHHVKRRISALRRAALPLQEPIHRAVAVPSSLIPADLKPYFGDVVDHLRRLEDQLDHLDGVVAMCFEVYATQISLRQNEDMRRISAWAALVLVPTLVAGIYGMNFRVMPELEWRYGYAWALGLMAVAVGVLWVLLKRFRWL